MTQNNSPDEAQEPSCPDLKKIEETEGLEAIDRAAQLYEVEVLALAADKQAERNALAVPGPTTAESDPLAKLDYDELARLADLTKEDALNGAYALSYKLRTMIRTKMAAIEEANRRAEQQERARKKERKKQQARLRKRRQRAKQREAAPAPSTAPQRTLAPLPVDWRNPNVTPNRPNMFHHLEIWTQTDKSKRAEKLRQSGERRLRELVRFIDHYGWFLDHHGRAPTDGEMAKKLRCSRHMARKTRLIVEALYAPSGPWHRFRKVA